MTVHKSKGLEFPVVILADANGILADLRHAEDWIGLNESDYGIPFFYSSISKSIRHLSPQTEEIYLKNTSKQELASMNTAYVAMTRPVEHLYILSQPITHSKDYSFELLLKDFLINKGIYDEESNKYNFGIKTSKDVSNKSLEKDEAAFLSFDIQRFYDTLTANETITKSDNIEQIYGEKVHEILQKIKRRDDIKKIDADDETRLKVIEVLEHSELSDYFKNHWSVYNEMDLVDNGELLRPDRVCIKDDDAVIIDYKTGIERESHLNQLTRYKVALEAMGFSIKSAFLVYIRKNIYIKTL